MCPGWVRGEVNKLCNDLDGRHDLAMVAAVCVLGVDGFDVKTREQAVALDPAEYGPAMLTGYSILAGSSLAAVFSSALAAYHGSHVAGLPVAEQQAICRQKFDQVFRQWLGEVIQYAGAEFQRGKVPTGETPMPPPLNPAVVGASQVLAVWQQIAGAAIKLTPKEERSNGEVPGGPEHGDEPGGADPGPA